jgi:hypothetical protein
MKPLFFSLFFLSCLPNYSQQFSYQKEWSTYYFGAKTTAKASALDSEGNSVVVGYINPAIEQSLPEQYEPSSYYDQWATAGAYQTTFNVNGNLYEGYVTKFNPEGGVLWSTYFGGVDYDYITDVATDSNNNIYIVGFTNSSSGIATDGSYISTISSLVFFNSDINSHQGFLAKFSPTGILQWSTYIPSRGFNDQYISLTVAGNDMVYVYGSTTLANANFVPSASAFQQTFYTYPTNPQVTPNNNGFILKFDGGGNKIAGTFCGSSIYQPSAITTDSEGNVLIVGSQYYDTPENIATANSYQSSSNGSAEGFISKFSADLSTRIWSTYYGDTVLDHLDLITTSGTDIYIHGRSYDIGTGIMATPGAYSETTTSGYLAKFTGAGARVWGTYLPFIPTFANINTIYDMMVKNNNLYIAGVTRQVVGISTPGAYQSNLASTSNIDGFMMQFTTDGIRNWGSYFGGDKKDYITNIAVIDDNTFYLYGFTNSDATISTANSLQPDINYGSAVVTPTTSVTYIPTNMFLAKFSNPLSVPTVSNNLVKLAPNPSDGQFTLSGNWHVGYNNLKLQLYDSLGKEVAHEDIAPFQEELHQGFDCRGLAQGLYFAKLTAGQEVLQTIKILIK